MFLQFNRFIDGHIVFVRASSIMLFISADGDDTALFMDGDKQPFHVRCTEKQLIEALNVEMRIV